jgi:hypothetical protein
LLENLSWVEDLLEVNWKKLLKLSQILDFE